ncbi:ATP-binding protein [Streptomyces asiaticus]|uniref:ATP-binding protein n=1 Tax=Streptomyces asiaticus TaxID=114695 RepID=UPI003F67670F
MAVTTATGAEILAEVSAKGTTDTLPTVLDDLSLTIKRPPVPEGRDAVAAAGVWVGVLRRIGAAKLNYWGLPDLVENGRLLISELVTNALRHGKGPEVVFRFIIGVDLIVLEVDDGSPGRPEVRVAEPTEENGRGMFLVDSIANSWGVSEDGTRTWCTLAAPASARRGRRHRGSETGGRLGGEN